MKSENETKLRIVNEIKNDVDRIYLGRSIMNYYKLFFCVVAIFVLTSAGCRENKPLVETKGEDDLQITSDTFISISKSETLDQWFTLTISADGETVYTPTYYNGYNRENLPPQNVPVKSRISREQLEEIVREFEKQKFFSLKDSYEQGSSDCEGRVLDAGVRTIAIRIGGRNKFVCWKGCQKDDEDFPPEIFAIFKTMNEVMSRKQG